MEPEFTIIYFSPTGNVRHLAILLADELDCSDNQVLPLEFTNPKGLTGTGHLVLMFPIHGFNAPRTVRRFVRILPPDLSEAVSLIAVGSAGIWVNDAASLGIRKILQKKHYSVVVDEHLAMPLTFVMNFPEALNRKLIPEAEIKVAELGQAIRKGLASDRNVALKSRILSKLGRGESPAARLFGLELHANKDCTSCRTCWKNCPEGNIREKSNGRPGFAFSCSMCMRCIYSCPVKAISPRISKFIPVKGGYDLNHYLEK